ncbi:glycosyltransferase family 2 protein [Streptomyces fractus]|uniref:glycosyltransferase family 2 protein n=1 Tax=Streptomyces fractus TaxID=641806 RepID=UPI003CEC7A26
MSLKVSVVVPVFNPGPFLDECVNSLLRQSMPQQEFEVVFVNDGSTDGSEERLEELCRTQPTFSVIHQANSGGPGQPRNVGAQQAQGEYIVFLDSDDWLGDEALERMYDFATANNADVLAGRLVGKKRAVPRVLFQENRPQARLDTAPLIDSLTAHKMLRREFLIATGLRFPEGRRTLVSHPFVAGAYLLAGNVAVLSDYICFYLSPPSTTGGFESFSTEEFFQSLDESFSVVERNTAPGELRDKLFRRWLRVEMVERMRGQRLLKQLTPQRDAMLEWMRSTIASRFSPAVISGLQPAQQIIASLLVGGLTEDLLAFAQWESGLRVHSTIDRMEWAEGKVRLEVSAELRVGEQPLLLRKVGGADVLEAPLSDAAKEIIAKVGADTRVKVKKAKLEIALRNRKSSAEISVPVEATPERIQVAVQSGTGSMFSDRFRVVLHGSATVSPEAAVGLGTWDPNARIRFAGWNKAARMGGTAR